MASRVVSGKTVLEQSQVRLTACTNFSDCYTEAGCGAIEVYLGCSMILVDFLTNCTDGWSCGVVVVDGAGTSVLVSDSFFFNCSTGPESSTWV